MTVNANLKFPVLCFNNTYVAGGGGISKRNFCFCGAHVLTDWTDHTHHYLLDANGDLYKVNSIKESEFAKLTIKQKLKLSITNIFAPLLYLKKNAPKSVWIDYDVTYQKRLSLEEAKLLLRSEVLRVNPRWTADGPSIREFMKLRESYVEMSDLTGSDIAEGK